MPPAHVRCLEMLEPVLTLDAGARIYAPGGTLLRDGELLEQPGLVRALELLRDEGADSVYTGSIAEALLALCAERGGVVTREDLAAYRATWSEPVEVAFAGTRFLTRGGLSGVPDALSRLPAARRRRRARRDARRSRPTPTATRRTSSPSTQTATCACITTSLGLGSGDYLPGLDLHLNSMLGEADLVRGEARPGRRMSSMMAPSIALDDDGPALAIGAAGGTRLRTALVGVASAILERDVRPQEAIDAGRAHPVGELVHAEPGVSEDGAGRARAPRTVGAALARPPPLLRRRQRDWAERSSGGSSSERLGTLRGLSGRSTESQPT